MPAIDDDDVDMEDEKVVTMDEQERHFYVQAMSLLYKLAEWVDIQNESDVTVWTSALKFLSRYLSINQFVTRVCLKLLIFFFSSVLSYSLPHFIFIPY